MANTLEIIVAGTDKASKTLGGISSQIDKMGKKMQVAGALMVGAGVAITGAIFKMADSYTEAGDEIAKMAKKTGMSTEALSEMKYMADMSGTSLSGMEVGIRTMQGAITDASFGLATYTRAFEALGLNIEEVKAMKPEDQFWVIAEAIAAVEDPTLKAATAADIFGRSGTELLPILAEGKEGLAKMKQEAKDLNVVFDKESAAAAEKFQDSKERISKALAGLGAEIINDIIPILTKYMEKLVTIVGRVKDWAEMNPKLAETLLKVGVILIGAGGLVFAFGTLARAIVAINAALVVMHALAGPAGWVKLAAGIAIAGGSIIGIQKLMAIPEVTVPSYQFGGIVPGPIGQPIPIIAHGGEQFLGDGMVGGGVTVNVTVEGSVIAERDLAETIRQQLYDIRRHNVSLEMA